MFLRADGAIAYARVAQVMGALNAGGFNEIGRRPRYYPAANNGREDAIVMAMELLD